MITDLYCNTCGKEVHKSRQYVTIKDHLWEEVCNKLEISKGLVICKDCIEKALGRKLQKEDYYNEEEPIYLEEPTEEELEKKLNDYVQIESISIDMSTEEAPYNRIYAKPIEKQGDILLCEFESANYDIEQKALKEELENRMNLERQLYKYVLEENEKLKESLKEYKKQLSEIKNAYINLTTQDEYGSYYIDEAKLFVEIVGKTIKDFKTESLDD